MKLNPSIPVFGDSSYRGKCPTEDIEQINFFSWLKFNYPEYANLFIHPKIEGKRTGVQITYDQKTGAMQKSMPDLMIICENPFCVELKRQDHTKSKWQDGQQEKLESLSDAGCFTGIALGADAAKEAFKLWLTKRQEK